MPTNINISQMTELFKFTVRNGWVRSKRNNIICLINDTSWNSYSSNRITYQNITITVSILMRMVTSFGKRTIIEIKGEIVKWNY